MSQCEIAAPGSIVRATAGREKGRLYAVLDTEQRGTALYAALADGKERKVERPKWKKAKHIQMLCVSEQSLCNCIQKGSATNRAIKAVLSKWQSQADAAFDQLGC